MLCFVKFHIQPTPSLDYISSIPLPLPPNPSKFTLMFDFSFDDSNPFEFFGYYYCVVCNMVTFHAIGRLDFTNMVEI
jgi:hypothetical protein